MKKRCMQSLYVGAVVLCAAGLVLAESLQGGGPTPDTAFTYQGDLQQGGAPANGEFQIKVSLWNDQRSGNQIGSTLELVDVPVTDGALTLTLNFGADAFATSGRWLQLEVDGFVLAPRQAVTRSPFSIQTRGIFVDDALRVGIGTTAPERDLDIAAVEPVLRLTSSTDSPPDSARLQLKRGVDSLSIARKLGDIEFINLNDEVEASISATRLAGTSTRLDVNVGVASGSPQLSITPDSVEFGTHHIRPPIAYGTISGTDGSIMSASDSVLSVQRINVGVYWIFIDGGVFESDVMAVSLRHKGYAQVTEVNNGTMIVQTFNPANNLNNQDRDFSFIVYRP